MHALFIIRRNITGFLDHTIHAARLKTFFWLAGVLIIGNKLSLTALGRAARGSVLPKHNIKRVDRFIGNKKFHKEVILVFSALAELLISKILRPIICVDWTPIGEDHYGLVASVPVDGRALPIYEEVYKKKDNNTDRAHREFLKNLKKVVPQECKPIIVTDAGFKNPWFKEVFRLGWDYLGRTGSNTKASKEESDKWETTKSLMKKAGRHAQNLGEWFLAKSNPIKGNLILEKKSKKPKLRQSPRRRKNESRQRLHKKNLVTAPLSLGCSSPR